jgi:hypothetical protein
MPAETPVAAPMRSAPAESAATFGTADRARSSRTGAANRPAVRANTVTEPRASARVHARAAWSVSAAEPTPIAALEAVKTVFAPARIRARPAPSTPIAAAAPASAEPAGVRRGASCAAESVATPTPPSAQASTAPRRHRAATLPPERSRTASIPILFPTLKMALFAAPMANAWGCVAGGNVSPIRTVGRLARRSMPATPAPSIASVSATSAAWASAAIPTNSAASPDARRAAAKTQTTVSAATLQLPRSVARAFAAPSTKCAPVRRACRAGDSIPFDVE